MATIEQMERALVNAHNAGDVGAARTIAAEIKKARAAPRQENYDPTAGMSPWEKVAAGAGKAIVDAGRGIGSLVGLVSQEDIDSAKRRDAALMESPWAIGGNVAGNLATMIGPAAVLGAVGKAAQVPAMVNAARAFMMPKTVAGAATAGGALGAIQPVASDESRIQNTLVGAGGGAAIPAAITGTRLVKDVIAPFTKSGREKLAGRVLERFAKDPNTILQRGQELVPGSVPTLAESTQDVGIAQLQRSLRNNPDANIAITERMLANQDARLNALRGIAGDAGQREFFDASRNAAARELYQKAFDEAPLVTPWVKGQITQLMKRPAFASAWKDAVTLAKNEGVNLDRKNIVQVAHYTKLALDDKIMAAKGNEQRALIATKDKLVSLMESKDFAPSYKEARETFAAMSKPINQMDLGKTLLDDLQPALSEFGATVRATPQKYAASVRNLDDTAKRATGFRGAKAEKILDPAQLSTIESVAKDLGRSANAQELGRAAGSPTSQNLVGQDILRQALGPLGLPKGFAETALADSLLRPVTWAYKAPEQRVLGLLGDVMTNPDEARRLLEMARRMGLFSADNLIPYTPAIGASGLLGLSQ